MCTRFLIFIYIYIYTYIHDMQDIYIYLQYVTSLFHAWNQKKPVFFHSMTTSQLKDYLPQSSSRHIFPNGFVRLDYCTEVGIEELANEGAQL